MLISGDPAIGCDTEKEFDCGGDGKMCIPLDLVCNHKNDCGNWADEPKDLCNVNECSQSLNQEEGQEKGQELASLSPALCDQQCIDLPIGYKCACKEGYQLVDNSTCQGQLKKNPFFTFCRHLLAFVPMPPLEMGGEYPFLYFGCTFLAGKVKLIEFAPKVPD